MLNRKPKYSVIGFNFTLRGIEPVYFETIGLRRKREIFYLTTPLADKYMNKGVIANHGSSL